MHLVSWGLAAAPGSPSGSGRHLAFVTGVRPTSTSVPPSSSRRGLKVFPSLGDESNRGTLHLYVPVSHSFIAADVSRRPWVSPPLGSIGPLVEAAPRVIRTYVDPPERPSPLSMGFPRSRRSYPVATGVTGVGSFVSSGTAPCPTWVDFRVSVCVEGLVVRTVLSLFVPSSVLGPRLSRRVTGRGTEPVLENRRQGVAPVASRLHPSPSAAVGCPCGAKWTSLTGV